MSEQVSKQELSKVEGATVAGPIGVDTSPEQKEVVDPLTKVIPSPRALISSMEDLTPVLERHRKWVDSVLSPKSDVLEGRANLAGADLSGYDLSGVILSGATLTGTKLIGTLFRGATLKGTDFSGANAQGADFSGAKLQRSKFERADLRDCEFGNADVTGADFRFARRGSMKDQEVSQDGVETSSEAVAEVAPEILDVEVSLSAQARSTALS